MRMRFALWLASGAVAFAGCDAARPPTRTAETAPAAAPQARDAAAADETPSLVPLKITLPRPAFITCGPRRPYPGVDTPSGPRPALMVPPGTRNVALGCPVSASDRCPIIGDPEQVTDGEKGPGKGTWVEFGPGTQWVQVDLGGPCELWAVVVWHCQGDLRVCHDVVVQVADDPDFVKNSRTLFNNDRDNSSGLGVGRDGEYYETFQGGLVEARGARAGYVRLYSNGSSADELNRYTEVEVYGLPTE